MGPGFLCRGFVLYEEGLFQWGGRSTLLVLSRDVIDSRQVDALLSKTLSIVWLPRYTRILAAPRIAEIRIVYAFVYSNTDEYT